METSKTPTSEGMQPDNISNSQIYVNKTVTEDKKDMHKATPRSNMFPAVIMRKKNNDLVL